MQELTLSPGETIRVRMNERMGSYVGQFIVDNVNMTFEQPRINYRSAASMFSREESVPRQIRLDIELLSTGAPEEPDIQEPQAQPIANLLDGLHERKIRFE